MTAIFGAQLMTAFRQHSSATRYRTRHTALRTRVQIPPAHLKTSTDVFFLCLKSTELKHYSTCDTRPIPTPQAEALNFP